MVRVKKNSSLQNKTVIAGIQHLQSNLQADMWMIEDMWRKKVRQKITFKRHLCTHQTFSTSDSQKLILTNKPKLLIALLLLDICQIICYRIHIPLQEIIATVTDHWPPGISVDHETYMMIMRMMMRLVVKIDKRAAPCLCSVHLHCTEDTVLGILCCTI